MTHEDVPRTPLDELSQRAVPRDDGRGAGARPLELACLVTNDDGIASEGLRYLALVARDAGLDVTVAAPLRDSSGASASISALEESGRFVVERRRVSGLEGCNTYGVGGLPAFIALTAARGAFGRPPDIVLSGINSGPNTGHAILHSGTVGAALTASTFGCRAMAVSLYSGGFTGAPGVLGADPRWETAAEVARGILPWLIDAPGGTVLNLNVPNLPASELRGLRRADLAPFGAVQTNVVEKGEGYMKIALTEIDEEPEPGTDAALLNEGFATITPLQAVCVADSEVIGTSDPHAGASSG